MDIAQAQSRFLNFCFFSGAQLVDAGTSCSSLKQSGVYKSGYYNIKADGDKKVVFCDMSGDTYEAVAQQDEMSFAPVGTILAWTMRVDAAGNTTGDIPRGWQRCDGSTIPPPSVWAGQTTPDLNTERRFLRGGSDETVLSVEEDMMQDHTHGIQDPGHLHEINDYSFVSGGGCCSSGGYNGHNSVENSVSSTTGVSVTGVSSGYRYGEETRPKNMQIVYIIRVW